ncbi:MAG: hypothetical protein U1F10_16690 [Burkholderiales bacterium]
MFAKSICIFLAAMSCGVPASINLTVLAVLNAGAFVARRFPALRATSATRTADYGIGKDPHPAV